MPCLPESGGCEKHFTDPLVAHLNHTESANYEHRACLDMTERTVPQPEALYEDTKSGHQLVIERKSISWPVNYAYCHNNDHVVGEVFLRELSDIAVDSLYEIRLPMLMEGKRAKLTSYACDAVKRIRSNWSSVAAGSMLKNRTGDAWWWTFRKLPEWDRDDDSPNKGLKISFEGPGLCFDDFLDPAQLPQALSSAIAKIYANCSKKFAPYLETRRILLLDPHGDLQTEGTDWWQAVWVALPPPSQIQEIWSGLLNGDTDDEDWKFERLYSASTTKGNSLSK